MAVVLYRLNSKGEIETNHSDPHFFEDEVKHGGWFLSKEEALNGKKEMYGEDHQEKDEEDEEGPVLSTKEEILAKMSDDAVKKLAKKKKIPKWHLKSIDTLKRELRDGDW